MKPGAAGGAKPGGEGELGVAGCAGVQPGRGVAETFATIVAPAAAAGPVVAGGHDLFSPLGGTTADSASRPKGRSDSMAIPTKGLNQLRTLSGRVDESAVV